MPIKREANDSPATSVPNKLAKHELGEDAPRDDTPDWEMFEEALKKIQSLEEAACEREDLVETLEKDLEEEQHKNARLEGESWVREDLVDALEKDLADEQLDNALLKEAIQEIRTKLEQALQLTEDLSNDIEAWRQATKGLAQTPKDQEASTEMPSYLSDPEIAHKIVKHYEDRVDEKLKSICEKLKDEDD